MSESKIIDTTANPAPLGLLAFGMTTILLNLHNVGFFPLDSMILGMGFFFGGLAQLIAGAMEWKKGNTFAATAFSSYGSFWLALIFLVIAPKWGIGIAAPAADAGLAVFLLVWGLYTLVMFRCTFHLNRALQYVFGTLTLLFFLLALANVSGNGLIMVFAGLVGILCGAIAMYTGLAQVLNEVAGTEVWPLDVPLKKGKAKK